jgi:hypothetical protein
MSMGGRWVFFRLYRFRLCCFLFFVSRSCSSSSLSPSVVVDVLTLDRATNQQKISKKGVLHSHVIAKRTLKTAIWDLSSDDIVKEDRQCLQLSLLAQGGHQNQTLIKISLGSL